MSTHSPLEALQFHPVHIPARLLSRVLSCMHPQVSFLYGRTLQSQFANFRRSETMSILPADLGASDAKNCLPTPTEYYPTPAEYYRSGLGDEGSAQDASTAHLDFMFIKPDGPRVTTSSS